MIRLSLLAPPLLPPASPPRGASPVAPAIAPASVVGGAGQEGALRSSLRLLWAWARGLGTSLTHAPPAASGTYTVQPGDSLSLIAARQLGDMARWPEIFEANRHQITNPNLIFPGQVLRLPGAAPAPAPAPAPAAPPVRTGAWPWPAQGRVSSPFGHRADPISGHSALHTGLDIAAPAGAPVRVPVAGVVVSAGWTNNGGGNMITIDHGGGIQTVYAHLSAIHVRPGQAVSPGAHIGAVGSTGYSTGPHLHFEVKQNGQSVDPRPWLG